jgi:hypothetical protein
MTAPGIVEVVRCVRAYLLKDEFQFFWSYASPYALLGGTLPGSVVHEDDALED